MDGEQPCEEKRRGQLPGCSRGSPGLHVVQPQLASYTSQLGARVAVGHCKEQGGGNTHKMHP